MMIDNNWLPVGNTIYGLDITRPSSLYDEGLPVGSSPSKVILHTTEGYGTPYSVATDLRSRAPVHLVADLKTGSVVQCISLERGAKGLKNLPGGVNTNTIGKCVQIECIRFARDGASWSNKELDRLGALLWMIDRRIQMGRRTPGFKNPKRMSYSEWSKFKGVCGHVHVPENDHWDPGKINFARVQATMRALSRHDG